MLVILHAVHGSGRGFCPAIVRASTLQKTRAPIALTEVIYSCGSVLGLSEPEETGEDTWS